MVGLGLRATVPLWTIQTLLHELNVQGPSALALPAFRADIAVVAQLRAAGHHITLIERAALYGVQTPSLSPRSLHHYGTGSVAEACALLALGAGAQILHPRRISADRLATAALAVIPDERPPA